MLGKKCKKDIEKLHLLIKLHDKQPTGKKKLDDLLEIATNFP